MQNNMIEQIKKIIEEKKQESAKQGYIKGIEAKQTNGARKAIKSNKAGGKFDK
ncbi:MAG: hypothetical protein WBJ13_07500 [Sedimentibacter sp.]